MTKSISIAIIALILLVLPCVHAVQAIDASTQTHARNGSSITSAVPNAKATASKQQSFHDCPKQCPEMVILPSGHFMMGSQESEEHHHSDEGPLHLVTIDYILAVAKYDTTFDDWDSCLADGGCGGYRPDDNGWGRGRHPVINVSWSDAQEYVQWLRRKTGKAYRLLSESEWEYAARGGTTTPYYTGANITADWPLTHPQGDANFNNWLGHTTAVGQYHPNPFGLFDMAGNVSQWLQDCSFMGGYTDVPSDGRPQTMRGCPRRAFRGGSWFQNSLAARSAARSVFGLSEDAGSTALGFRVARTIEPAAL